jgi:two-component system LytT family sensor kinase
LVCDQHGFWESVESWKVSRLRTWRSGSEITDDFQTVAGHAGHASWRTQQHRYGLAMSLTTVGYFAFASVAILDIDKILCFGSESFPSMAMLCSSFFIFLMLLDKTLRLAKEEKRKNQRVLDYDRVKQESLREQIKPHFIFNCLTAIENNYHQDTSMGDEAMNLFAHHLRSDVDSMGVDLIPFEDEISNTMNYVSLENLRIEKPFHLLLNIAYQDFLVPPFSLQPLVENSIKYSKVNEKEDGFIIISSSLNSEGNVVVEVSDNGIGYDVTQVSSNSVGIKNLTERFQILLNAKLSVISMPGKGTKTTITFHKKLL